MKSTTVICFLLSALIATKHGFAQDRKEQTQKNQSMDSTAYKNKEIIRSLYENILNNRRLELLDTIVSNDYSNNQEEKGVEIFKRSMTTLIEAFPDAKWTITEMIGEGNKVSVKQKVEGTHKKQFQNIAPTNKDISVEGMAIFELEEGKIINHQIQTDRLGFMQQLGVLPVAFTGLPKENETKMYFVDKFSIPKNAITEFLERMDFNWNFIKPLPGFIKHDVIVHNEINGDLSLMTIAIWENQESLEKAKYLVQNEYKKTKFNPQEFMERLNVKMERQIYKAFQK